MTANLPMEKGGNTKNKNTIPENPQTMSTGYKKTVTEILSNTTICQIYNEYMK